MKIVVRINYHTNWGENLFVCGSAEVLGKWNPDKALALHFNGHGEWEANFEVEELDDIQYKYFIKSKETIKWEFGDGRTIKTGGKIELVEARDFWRSTDSDNNVLYQKPYTDIFFKPNEIITTKKSTAKCKIHFSINEPKVEKEQSIAIIGNQEALGNWKKPVLLSNSEYPNWNIEFNLANFKFPVEYKYVKVNLKTNKIENWEEGDERKIFFINNNQSIVHNQNDEYYRDENPNFKAAGVAVPIFSIRSKESFGVGEFTDLKKLVDWAVKTKLKMIQVLPINETIATHSWLDSYPYKAISVFALHPMYMHLDTMGTLQDAEVYKTFQKEKTALNKKPYVDYEKVMQLKSAYFKLLFDQDWNSTKNTKAFKAYFSENEEWLKPYAAFCYLRDKYKTGDFRQWGTWSTYKKTSVEKLVNAKSKNYKDIAIHYFIQFHLNKQLQEAVEYTHAHGISLKGDLPIGISPNSVEAWTLPKLFNLNGQAGAPPDDFAVLGQNWGFPTYNWDAMEQNNYQWWKNRLGMMSKYFDAYRIDHILGFFRIWEIPIDALHGLLGYFKPAIPFTISELQEWDIWFDADRFTKPYIRSHFLHRYFGEYTEEVKLLYLNEYDQDCFELKNGYQTQREIYNHFTPISDDDEKISKKNIVIRDGLINLLDEVIFIKDPYAKNLAYHPRIAMHFTNNYNELDFQLKEYLNKVYIHYFYERNEELWKEEAMKKLPAIMAASNMLVCGEDLGMIPDNVPSVMQELNILSLEIQRMPKNPNIEFAHPSDAPYLSVCTTSTHDMKTVRGWWEENRAKTQYFYNHLMGENGEAPQFAEPWICQKIINQHIYSKAMWTIFPIQDLLAMDGDLRWDETDKERINIPSDVKNKWRYRMIQDIDELNDATEFNELLRSMIVHSKR